MLFASLSTLTLSASGLKFLGKAATNYFSTSTMNMIQAAYSNKRAGGECFKELQKNTAQNNLQKFSFNKQDAGYVHYNPQENRITVSFKGTDTLNDWMTDLDVRSKNLQEFLPGLRQSFYAHSGFAERYAALRSDVMKSVEKMLEDHPDARLEITGHSMGGALAQIAALDFKRFNVSAHVTALNAPRVFEEESARKAEKILGANITRAHVKGDWLDLAPKLGFAHIGEGFTLPSQSYNPLHNHSTKPLAEFLKGNEESMDINPDMERTIQLDIKGLSEFLEKHDTELFSHAHFPQDDDSFELLIPEAEDLKDLDSTRDSIEEDEIREILPEIEDLSQSPSSSSAVFEDKKEESGVIGKGLNWIKSWF